jgi:hypothetical protein
MMDRQGIVCDIDRSGRGCSLAANRADEDRPGISLNQEGVVSEVEQFFGNLTARQTDWSVFD